MVVPATGRTRRGIAMVAIAVATLTAACAGFPANPAAPTGPPTDAPVVAGPGPRHLATLPPGSRLPSGAQCAEWVRWSPLPESKSVNVAANALTGQHLGASAFDPKSNDPRANSQVAVRVDGAFTGTTHEILRWAACKWGVDEDMVYAQAAKESWWRQPSLGDFEVDPAACPPGHGLGADGRPGQCPQSFGILQDRYPFLPSSWPGIHDSTAMSADTAYAVWRSCFEGYERWLGTVAHGQPYAAGDAWGCVGRWVSGRWHTAAAEQYIAGVRRYETQRVWEQADFVELTRGPRTVP
jgi:hypothetical protein